MDGAPAPNNGTHAAARPEDISLSTLLGEDMEPFERALEAGGPLAVVGAPFAGREHALDQATADLGATRLQLGPEAAGDCLPATFDEPFVIDDCHHLYARRVGGFDGLDAFVDRLARAEAQVVTSWNRYAYAYLAAVRALDDAFSTTVTVGPVDAERLADLLLSRYDEPPVFDVDADDNLGRTVSIAGIEFPLPFGDIGGNDVDPQDIVFERLAAVSEGNVGVATAIWEAGHSREIRPSDIAMPVSDLDLDREAAFCLRVILAKERVTRAELAAVVGADVDRILGRLVRAGIIERDAGIVQLRPTAVTRATAATEERRIL